MDPPNPPGPAEPAPARLGARGLAIIPLLVTSPGQAFERIRADPQWLGPCLLVVALIGAATAIRLPQDLVLAEAGTVAAMERFGVPDADIDEALALLPDPDDLTAGVIAIQVLQGLAGIVPLQFFAALVLHWIGRLGGAMPRFRASLAVFWTASLAGATGALIKAILVRSQDTVEVSLGPAALAGLDYGSLPYLFLEIFDLFSLLALMLFVTGVRIVYGTSAGAGWGIGGGFWALAALLQFVTTAAFSWFSGTL